MLTCIVYYRWAIGGMLGMVVSGGVSGGHINPAITVAMASVGKFPWAKVALLVSCYSYHKTVH